MPHDATLGKPLTDPFLCSPWLGPEPIVSRVMARRFGLPENCGARKIIRWIASARDDELGGFTNPLPPPGVHWIGSQSGVFADPASCDEIATVLRKAGLNFKKGSKYLDFGCSSGRTVRTMQFAMPWAEWHGADPDAATIEWAQQNSPEVSFLASSPMPPLPYEDSSFTGVYAISVWSHFRESAALAWFDEMRRILSAGGFIAFTTHGHARLQSYMSRYPERAQRWERLSRKLTANGFLFNDNPGKTQERRERRGVDTTIWGTAQLSPIWVVQNLLGPWCLRYYQPGGHRRVQDIYVLQKTG